MPKFEATARQNPRKENLIALPNKVSAVPKYMDWTDDLPMSDTYDILAKIMKERIIIIIDGAMGTSILKYKSLTEADFRGVVCPLNYVKTKLLLDKMEKGQILSILLDEDGCKNVPESARGDGNKVLSVASEDDHWRVVLRKG